MLLYYGCVSLEGESRATGSPRRSSSPWRPLRIAREVALPELRARAGRRHPRRKKPEPPPDLPCNAVVRLGIAPRSGKPVGIGFT